MHVRSMDIYCHFIKIKLGSEAVNAYENDLCAYSTPKMHKYGEKVHKYDKEF